MIEDNIIKNRPNIRSSSVKQYITCLKILRKKIDGKNDMENTDFLNDYTKVIELIKDEKITTQKNRLVCVIVALSANDKPDKELIDKYQKRLKELNNEYVTFLKTQKKTDTQEKNWIEYDDLVKIYNTVMQDIKHYDITKKEILNDKEFDLLQQLVILRTYIDNPLRNDFADMKVINAKEYKKLKDDDKNNYLAILKKNKKIFILNDFKNRKIIGKKQIEITPSLNKIINSWLKYNKSGYFLVKKDRKTPMNPNGITKYLNKIFDKRIGKKISSSMIRHIIISKVNENQPTILEEEKKEQEVENKFLHSGTMNKLYRKI